MVRITKLVGSADSALKPEDITQILHNVHREDLAADSKGDAGSKAAAEAKAEGKDRDNGKASAAEEVATLGERRLECELNYPDFLEALVAVAHYRNPDPFLPLPQRFDQFLTRDLLPTLQRIIK